MTTQRTTWQPTCYWCASEPVAWLGVGDVKRPSSLTPACYDHMTNAAHLYDWAKHYTKESCNK